MTSIRFARLTFAALAATTLAVGVSTSPASAVIADTDDERVATLNADFGTGVLVAGTPGFGRVDWDVAGGLTTPSAVGTIYATPGTCARMRLESYDLAHVLIDGDNGTTRCGIAGGANQWSVNLSNTGDPDTTHVHVVVQTLSGAVWTNAGLATTNLGD